MSRLPLIDPATATGPLPDLFAEVQRRLGIVPNMTRAMANSPALLAGYIDLSGALSRGAIHADTRQRLALTVAQCNGCSYCLSAHAYVGEHVLHMPADTINDARKATAADPKTSAILAFAAAVNDGRGEISDTQLAAARSAGVTDEELAETIAHVALNVLTNFFNKAVEVDIDFPVIAA